MPQLSESVDQNRQRRDTLLSTTFTVVGLSAIILVRGGIHDMIAGSVGSIGAGCLAVGLTFLDGRLSYSQRIHASLPIVLMLAAAGISIHGNPLVLVGFPMLILGLAGLLPILARAHVVPPPVPAAESDGALSASPFPAISNS